MLADLLFENGVVLTQDRSHPESDALATVGERIVALGPEARAMRGPKTRVVDLRGRALIPGFIDAHNHFVSYGLRLMRLDLANVRVKEELLEAVRQRAGMTPKDGWIVGHSWDESKWREQGLPTQEELDESAGGRRTLLARVDRHGGLASTTAQEAAAISGGPFVVEADYDKLVRLTKPTLATLVKAVGAASRKALELGITSSHVMCTADDFAALQAARDAGVLGVRASCFIYEDELEHAVGLGARRGLGDAWVRLLGLKLFADGSLGSRTAAISFAYLDGPGNGMFMHAPARLEDLVRKADAAGLQIAVHAIGDRASRRVIDAFEAAGLGPAKRPRIEHLEMADDADVARAAALGVIASVQPNFTGEWGHKGGMYETRLGWDHARTLNRFRSYHEAGLALAFGSDDMPLGPLYGIRSAVEAPEATQRLTPEEAIAAYTRGAAWAGFAEDEVGTLAPGHLADLVVLSHDPRRELDACRVDATVLAGSVRYERSQ